MSAADGDEQERSRLLEYQLDYLRAELLHLVHERDFNTYSVAWRIFTPLRRLEAGLVGLATAAGRRLRGLVPRASTAPAPTISSGLAPGAGAPARRLLVDVTGTIKRDAGTGIQRVVKEVARALHSGVTFDIPAFAVRCENCTLLTANAFVASLGCAAPSGPDTQLTIGPGDRFLMLSDSWNAFEELAPLFEHIRAEGGEIASCIFDLIPELYPHACHETTVPRYAAWLRKGLLESDSFIAISRTVADELAAYVEKRGLPHRSGLKIGWFHCGSDIPKGTVEAPDEIRRVVADGAPMFLCVGTIEPRKGQRVALHAFDKLWSEGRDAKLVFVGRRGWFEEAVAAEILEHREYGRRLFWFDDVDDPALSWLYDRAIAILLPSYAEGFGLPIVEAARRSRPVLCSDIPVFREVGGAGAAYFRVNDAQALAACIGGFLDGEIIANPLAVSCVTWLDSARRIVEVVARDEWSRRLP